MKTERARGTEKEKREKEDSGMRGEKDMEAEA
jgi:hypothetical protein